MLYIITHMAMQYFLLKDCMLKVCIVFLVDMVASVILLEVS